MNAHPFENMCKQHKACISNRHSVFRPLNPQIWGRKSQSPPTLGDLGGCTIVYSIENRYQNDRADNSNHPIIAQHRDKQNNYCGFR
jgi:hypothetical protein